MRHYKKKRYFSENLAYDDFRLAVSRAKHLPGCRPQQLLRIRQGCGLRLPRFIPLQLETVAPHGGHKGHGHARCAHRRRPRNRAYPGRYLHPSPRAKKVELLARLYDHCENRFLRGFRMLTLAWSDGASLVPLDFALLSSTDPCNGYQGVTKDLDRRSCGAKRRREAVTKSTALLAPMVRRALEAGVKARYLLMDSWFGMPAIILALRPLIPVLCMVERTPKILYGFQGKRLSLDGIYRALKKRRGQAKILSSVVVAINDGEPARIVLVRDRRKKDWLALLTTDINLPDEEVVRIYGKRWDIEVFFRTAKQFLQLEKGSQARGFDTLIAHSTIVLMRYIFLALEQRRLDDPRSLGLLFHACCEEIRDVTYLESLKRILELAMAQTPPKDPATTDIYAALADAILGQAILYFGLQETIYQRSRDIAA
ncbi:transposase [Desulfolutivibrio sulfoxidireducens]|nr:transposase [Desulfolutivibrio sulfoxidireducens]